MPRTLEHHYASLEGEVLAGIPEQNRRGTPRSSVTMTFHNSFCRPVFWRTANGVLHIESAAFQVTGEEAFYITLQYEFEPGGKIDTRGLLNDLDLPEKHVERPKIYEALEALNHRARWHTHRQFHYTLKITKEAIDDAGGVVYINDVDLVIGYQAHADTLAHPYSRTGQRERVSQWVPQQDGFSQTVLLVDNSGVTGPLWFNNGFGTYELRPVVTNELRDGVYVANRDGATGNPTSEYYTFEEAKDVLGLYLSRSEAEAFGSPKEQHKHSIQQRELEVQTMKQNLKEKEAEAALAKQAALQEKEALDEERRKREERIRDEDLRRQRDREEHEYRMQRERDDLEHLKTQLKQQQEMERDRMKFEYERQSQTRKTTQETLKGVFDVLKNVLAIIGPLIGIYKAYQNSKQ